MQKKISNIAINQVIARLKRVFDVSTDSELAEYLGVRQNTISSWKSRGSIDYPLVIAKCDNVDLNWLFGMGEEKKSENFSEKNVRAKCEGKNVRAKDVLLGQNASPKQYDPADGLIHDFAADQATDQEQIDTLNKFIDGLQTALVNKTELLKAKEEVIRAKDEVIAAKEGQITALYSQIEQLSASDGLKPKKPVKSKTAAIVSDADVSG